MHTTSLCRSATLSILTAGIFVALIAWAVGCDDGERETEPGELDASSATAAADPSDDAGARMPARGAPGTRDAGPDILETSDGARPTAAGGSGGAAPSLAPGDDAATQVTTTPRDAAPPGTRGPGTTSDDAGSVDASQTSDARPATAAAPSCRGEFERCIDEHAAELWSLDLTSLPDLTDLALDIVTNLSLSPVSANAIEPCLATAEQCGLFSGQGGGPACLETFTACADADPLLLGTCIGGAETCGLFPYGASACFQSFVACNVDVFGIPDCLVEARDCGLKPLIPPLPF